MKQIETLNSKEYSQYVAFRKSIENAVNSNCIEAGSNTPDFVIASFLCECTHALNQAIVRREEWYGTYCKPCGETVCVAKDEAISDLSNQVKTLESRIMNLALLLKRIRDEAMRDVRPGGMVPWFIEDIDKVQEVAR